MTRRRLVRLAGIVSVFLVGSLAPTDGATRASTPQVRKEIVATVESQLTAFRKGEVEKAYGFAAAQLRAQKPLRTFAAIVQGSYPEIWRNTRAEFGIVRDDGAQATVTVQVYSKEGDAAYDFSLVKETAGWRIYGVVRHEPKQAGKV
jgi:hypothetical protein